MSRRVTRFAALLDLVIASRYPFARLLLKAIGEEPTYKKLILFANGGKDEPVPAMVGIFASSTR